mmetsp:Transcript_8678/g.39164  ORF Transcript_8678/g.39164 Transcript_8678/m.39164 type:complete len:217 (+) Transcript_8678:942-1592(+)
MRSRGWCRGLSRNHQLSLRCLFCDHQLSLRGLFCDHQLPLPLHLLHDGSVLRGDGVRRQTVLGAQLVVRCDSLVQGVYGYTYALAAAVLPKYPEPPVRSHQVDAWKSGNSCGALVELWGNSCRWRWIRVSIVLLLVFRVRLLPFAWEIVSLLANYTRQSLFGTRLAVPVAVWDSRETEAAVMSALGAAIAEEKVRLAVGLSAHETRRVILLHFAVT